MKDLKDKISDKAYYVTQEQGTEPAFTGELLDVKDDGVFTVSYTHLTLPTTPYV